MVAHASSDVSPPWLDGTVVPIRRLDAIARRIAEIEAHAAETGDTPWPTCPTAEMRP